MATADASILSPASCRYLAAILSLNLTEISDPFWHSAMNEWLTSSVDGALPASG
jgi:hypothetical protein